MSAVIEVSVRAWAADNPEFVDYLTTAVKHRIKLAIGSSMLSGWWAQARGAILPRKAVDYDLFVPNDQFDQAAGLLPGRRISYLKTARTLAHNGEHLSLLCDEATGQAERSIQLLRPHGSLRWRRHGYRTAFSALAADHIQTIETDQGLVPVVHPFEVVALDSLLQRGEPKHDAAHVANMLTACDPDGEYEQARMREIKWDPRAQQFMRQAGSLLAIAA